MSRYRVETATEVLGETAYKPPESELTEEKPQKHRFLSRNVMLWVRDIAIALVIAVILMQFIKPTIVREHSMMNTLHPDDYIFLSKQAYTFGSVKHGDIVVFHSDLEDVDGVKKNLIKRVIGLPGDTISIHNDSVYRNGEALDEPYTRDGVTEGTMEEITVPEGELFLMGDNRLESRDSRSPDIGCVPEDTLVGKAIFRLFPLDSIGTIK